MSMNHNEELSLTGAAPAQVNSRDGSSAKPRWWAQACYYIVLRAGHSIYIPLHACAFQAITCNYIAITRYYRHVMDM